MNKPITMTEIEAVIKHIPKNKSKGLDDFTREFYQTFREELMPSHLKLFPKNCRGRNISKLFLWVSSSWYQTRQRQHKKRKLQANISDEHRCKNPQQKFSKQNSATHQKAHTPWANWFYSEMQGFFSIRKSNNAIHHINKLKDKSQMIISIDAEKAFDKIQHPIMIKTLQKNGHKRNLPQYSEGHIW